MTDEGFNLYADYVDFVGLDTYDCIDGKETFSHWCSACRPRWRHPIATFTHASRPGWWRTAVRKRRDR